MLNRGITGNRQAPSTARFRRVSLRSTACWYLLYYSVIPKDGKPRPTQEFIYAVDRKEMPIKLEQ